MCAFLVVTQAPAECLLAPSSGQLWTVIVALAVAGIGWSAIVIAFQEFSLAARWGHIAKYLCTPGGNTLLSTCVRQVGTHC